MLVVLRSLLVRVAFIRKHINILFVFILPVYLYIVQNSIQNKHTHVYANGIVITHSHPLDKESDDPINKHNHSKTEICLYSSLHFDFYEAPQIAGLTIDLNETHKAYFVANETIDLFSPFLKTIPRGPPA
ncbi:hypothetical protein OU798_09580 [Prolixibacteraceae bacterium Z1-6]|uniref:Uncharacterized protein n=1 Tax=Draconibacterium aestuarii TaxID=2998507 RepID=A0A9X3F6C4_9BACT|nr:hypothetical protein [Prolixibacteraceae bacterium Z1-6]